MSGLATSCLLLSLFLVSTYAYLPLDASSCLTVRCGAFGPAICAKRKNAYQIFPSDCARFRKFCDDGQAWTPTSMNKCFNSICPLTCPVENNPVCATNGATYQSFAGDCAFMNFSCPNYSEEWVRAPLADCTNQG